MGVARLSPREREWVWAAIHATTNECQYCGEEINILVSVRPGDVSSGLSMDCDYCASELIDISARDFREAYRIYSEKAHKEIIKDVQEDLDNIMSDEEIDEIKGKLNRLSYLLDDAEPNPNRNKGNSPKDKI